MLLSLSCNKNIEDYFNPDGIADHIYRGPIVKMGDGSVRSAFTVSPTGVPLKLSIEMTDAALENLPDDPLDFEHSTFVLSIPQKAKDLTAFDHLIVNWNPKGHVPEHVYDVPHFDFHFYKISLSRQMAIPPYTDETKDKFDKLPPEGYMPATFVPTPGGVPQMESIGPIPNRTKPMASRLPKPSSMDRMTAQQHFTNPWLRWTC